MEEREEPRIRDRAGKAPRLETGHGRADADRPPRFGADLEQVVGIAQHGCDAVQRRALGRRGQVQGLRDVPQVSLTEEMHPITFNTTYWTGWPSAQDPYVHEGFWHRNALQMILQLEPAQ